MAQRKADRLAECHANVVAAEVCLTWSGSQHVLEARALLNRADALIDETGAKAYEPTTSRMRARKRRNRSRLTARLMMSLSGNEKGERQWVPSILRPVMRRHAKRGRTCSDS